MPAPALPAPALPAPALPRRQQFLVLAICCLSLLIVSMDVTIVNVALPSIRSSLNASLSGLQWVIDAYTLVLAGLLMLSGSMADRLGRRRTFQAGLVIFTLGSLLCSVAPSLGFLIGARVVQAVGGSMLNPVAMSIISNVFIDSRDRARAIGVWGGVVGLSMALGPVVGGLLTERVGWRAIFWINVPIGVLAFVLAARYVPESRAARARRVDPVGQLLVMAILVCFVYAIIDAPRAGWAGAEVLGLFGLGVVGIIALVSYEPRRRDPLLELTFFRSAPFSGATLTAVFAFAAFGGFLFLNTLYLQDVRGYSALDAGLCTLPMALASLVCAPLSGRLVAARGARLPLCIAGVGLAVSALLLTRLSATTPLATLLTAYFIFGVGFGMVNSPITNAAVSGMPRSQAGVAAGVASTSRQVGQSLGVALAGSIAGAATGAVGAGFAAATHPVWWLVVGCGLAVLTAGIVTTGSWARHTTEATAALFTDEPSAVLAGAR